MQSVGSNFETDEELAERFARTAGYDMTVKRISEQVGRTNRSWITRKVNNIPQKMLLKHFQGDKVIATPLYPHSKMLPIDIDARNQPKVVTNHYGNFKKSKRRMTSKKITRIIKELIGGEPICREYSNGGNIHLYFLMDDYIADEAKKKIEEELRQKHVVAELKNEMRLPFSKKYRQRVYNYKDEKIDELKQLTDTFDYRVDTEEKTVKVPNWLKPYNKQGTPIKKTRESLNKSNMDTEFFALNNDTTDRTYGNGTRHEEQPKIAFDAIRLFGITQEAYDYYVSMCEYWNDGTSKDMKAPHKKKFREVNGCWKNSVKRFDESMVSVNKGHKGQKPINLIGEHVYLNEYEFSFEDSHYNLIYNYLMLIYRKVQFGKLYGVIENRTIQEAAIVLEEMISKYKHDKDTKAHYEKEEYSDFNNAILFNYELKQKMKEAMGLHNIRRIFKLLEISGIIWTVKDKNGNAYKFSGPFRFAKHYHIHSIPNIKLMYNKLLKEYNYNNKDKDTGDNLINYRYKFFCYANDGSLYNRLERIRLWRYTHKIPYKNSRPP